MPGFFSLVRRRRQLLASSKSAERQLEEARAIVLQAQQRAALAHERLENTRGVGALPQADQPTTEDTQLIAALDAYDHVRRTVEVPLEEAHAAWKRDVEVRRKLRSVGHLVQAFFVQSVRATFVQELRTAELSLKATRLILNTRLTHEVLRAAASFTTSPEQSLQKYRQNNAAFIAALERLQTRIGPGGSGQPRGSYGGLPAGIAMQVESARLDNGPLTATLRRYQSFGARYLVLQERSLLGDDMGLGKTVQVLAAMCHLHANGARHFFVVAPNSVLVNWFREVNKHTQLTPFLLHGSERDENLVRWRASGGVAITTYGTLPKLIDGIGSIDFFAADEAHMAKNPDALRSQAVAQVADASRFVALMTGTALENRLQEMQNLVHIVQPDIVQQLAPILYSASGLVNPTDVVRTLAPVYLRRTQADVLTELPERVEMEEWVDLTAKDRDAYVLAPINVMSKRVAVNVGDGTRTSAKYERLLDLLEEHAEADRKVVVFSYFRQTIEDVSVLTGGSPTITGDTSGTQRQRMIDEFSTNPNARVLVSQIDAGGLGINLQAAQVVVLMEAQFKPSTEWQAIARVHRMGQSRKVMVHRLLARNTIEERLVQIIEEKTQIFNDYAHDSSVRDASAMAVDNRAGVTEADLQQFLNEE